MGRIHKRVKRLPLFASATIAVAAWILPVSSVAQQAGSLQLSAAVSFQNPSAQFGLAPYAGYELAFLFAPTSRLGVGLCAAFARPSTEYDVIGGTVTEDLRLRSVLFSFSFRAIDNGAIQLDLRTRLGLMTLSSNAQTVSAGGFGSITVPGQSDKRFICSTGPVISHELLSRLALFVSPELVLISPIQLNTAGYSIEGGLAFGIL